MKSEIRNSKLEGLLEVAIFAICLAFSQAAPPPESTVTPADLEHWSFRPLNRPEPPKISQPGLARNAIDHFIIAKLEANGLSLSPPADGATLIRRLSYDLTGLPPNPKDLAAFLESPSDELYLSYVESLLASPAYGERWAQHWLDLVRFAETDGFEHDATRENAWKFRDWVIEALNRDLPLDEFVSLQLAGDELCDGDEWKRLGTGFLVSGPDMPDLNSQDERRHIVLNDLTSTIGSAFLGLTMNCAQCHDHPYDPINQAAFYRLRAFFDHAIYPEGGKSLPHVVAEPGNRPPRSFVFNRGDYRDAGAEVAPWFPRIANPARHRPPPLLETMQANSTGRRTAFAAWLTAEDNPLFLRSLANRIWQHHFHKPLAGTPNDLGKQGIAPTHPELLDWLALELPKRGWSLKDMHRLIVTSNAYRQAGRPADETWEARIAKDPQNRLFSRYPRWQLSGEAIRDSMLAVSGKLNPKMGGPGVHLPLPKEVEVTLLKKHVQKPSAAEEQNRRSIYVFARRNLGYPMFDVYGRPDRQTSCAQRSQATTPTQALTQMNSAFARHCARDVAEALAAKNPADRVERARQSFNRILSRQPTEREFAAGLSFLTTQTKRTGSNEAAFRDFCLALFNSNAFLYVE